MNSKQLLRHAFLSMALFTGAAAQAGAAAPDAAALAEAAATEARQAAVKAREAATHAERAAVSAEEAAAAARAATATAPSPDAPAQAESAAAVEAPKNSSDADQSASSAATSKSSVAASGAAEVDLDAGRLLFTQSAVPACSICHALADAGSEGQIGPSLDELKPDAQRVKNALRGGIGVMPDYSALSDEEIALLARYVEAVTHAQ